MWKTTIELPIEMLKVKFTGRIILEGGYRLVDPLLIPDNHWSTFSSACKPCLDSRRSSIWFIFGYTYTFFVEKTCWAGNRAEIRNSLQQNTRWGAEPRKKAFSSTLFQQIQIFGKQSFQRKSSEMLRANKIFAKGV